MQSISRLHSLTIYVTMSSRFCFPTLLFIDRYNSSVSVRMNCFHLVPSTTQVRKSFHGSRSLIFRRFTSTEDNLKLLSFGWYNYSSNDESITHDTMPSSLSNNHRKIGFRKVIRALRFMSIFSAVSLRCMPHLAILDNSLHVFVFEFSAVIFGPSTIGNGFSLSLTSRHFISASVPHHQVNFCSLYLHKFREIEPLADTLRNGLNTGFQLFYYNSGYACSPQDDFD